MKKIICLVLAIVLAFSVTACGIKIKTEETTENTQESQSTTSQTETEATSQQTPEKAVEISVSVMKTDDWYSFDYDRYNGKEEITVSLSIPENYTVDGTVIYDALNKKFAEISGAVVYKDGQTAFDTVKENDTHYDLKCILRQTGTTTFENDSLPCSLAVFEGPSDDGQSYIYLYSYAVDFGDYCIMMTINADNKLKDLPEEHRLLLRSIDIK